MAASINRLGMFNNFRGNRRYPLVCQSCMRYISTLPPDGKVSQPGFVKRYFVDHIVNFVSGRTAKLEKRYPRVFELYRTFRSGTSTFLSETRDYYKVSTALWSGRSLTSLTRHELEVYKQIPPDLFRIVPLLLIAVLPGGGAVIAVAYIFPRLLLSQHFWTGPQKRQFWCENLESRLYHLPLTLDWVMRLSLYVDDQQMRNKLVRLLNKLEHSVQPSVDEISEVLPLFKSVPYLLARMPLTYVRHLAKSLNFWSLPSKLEIDGMILLYTDQAMVRDGLENMTDLALDKACFMRCLNPYGLTKQEKLDYLGKWVQLSQKVDESTVSFLLHCPAFLAIAHPNNLHLQGGKRTFWSRRKMP